MPPLTTKTTMLPPLSSHGLRANSLWVDYGLGSEQNTLKLAVCNKDLWNPTADYELSLADKYLSILNAHTFLLANTTTDGFLEVETPLIVDENGNHIAAYFEGAHRQFSEEFDTAKGSFCFLFHALRLLDALLHDIQKAEISLDLCIDPQDVYICIKTKTLKVLCNSAKKRNGEKKGTYQYRSSSSTSSSSSSTRSRRWRRRRCRASSPARRSRWWPCWGSAAGGCSHGDWKGAGWRASGWLCHFVYMKH